jgi:predicted transcriptional regulator
MNDTTPRQEGSRVTDLASFTRLAPNCFEVISSVEFVPGLKRIDAHVLTGLLLFGRRSGQWEVWPSTETLAAWSHAKRDSISESLGRLSKLDLLTKSQKRGQDGRHLHNVYRIHVETLWRHRAAALASVTGDQLDTAPRFSDTVEPPHPVFPADRTPFSPSPHPVFAVTVSEKRGTKAEEKAEQKASPKAVAVESEKGEPQTSTDRGDGGAQHPPESPTASAPKPARKFPPPPPPRNPVTQSCGHPGCERPSVVREKGERPPLCLQHLPEYLDEQKMRGREARIRISNRA